MNVRALLAGCVLTLTLASQSFAGAWTQKKGEYYLKLAGGYLNTTQDIDAMGDKVDKVGEGRLRDVNGSAYLEYGISDQLTLVGSAPYKNMKDTRTFQTGTALGEAVGVWRRRASNTPPPVEQGLRGVGCRGREGPHLVRGR